MRVDTTRSASLSRLRCPSGNFLPRFALQPGHRLYGAALAAMGRIKLLLD